MVYTDTKNVKLASDEENPHGLVSLAAGAEKTAYVGSSINEATGKETSRISGTLRCAVYNTFQPDEVYRLGLKLLERFLRFAKQRGICEADAEDIFQEVMIDFSGKAASLKKSGNVQGLIWQRLIGAVRDYWRDRDPIGRVRRGHIAGVERELAKTGDLGQALRACQLTDDDWVKLHTPKKGYGREEPVSSLVADDARDPLGALGASTDSHEYGIIGNEHALEIEEAVLVFFKKLSFKDALVFYMYYAHGNNMKQIAFLFQITESRISQIMKAFSETMGRRVKALRREIGSSEADLFGNIMHMNVAALEGLLEKVKKVILGLCKTSADRELLEIIINLNAEDGSAKLMLEVQRVGITNVSEKMLEALGFQRVQMRRGGQKNGAVWQIKRA